MNNIIQMFKADIDKNIEEINNVDRENKRISKLIPKKSKKKQKLY